VGQKQIANNVDYRTQETIRSPEKRHFMFPGPLHVESIRKPETGRIAQGKEQLSTIRSQITFSASMKETAEPVLAEIKDHEKEMEVQFQNR
jgi:hypothetical protein